MQATRRVAGIASRSRSFATLGLCASSSRVCVVSHVSASDTTATLRRQLVYFQAVRALHQTSLLLKAQKRNAKTSTSTSDRAKTKTTSSPSQVKGAQPTANAKGSHTSSKGPPSAPSIASAAAGTSSSQKAQTTQAPTAQASAQDTQLISSTTSETDVEAPKPNKTLTEKVKDLWATAKYLFKFYFNGVKQIWANRKLVKEVQARIAGNGTALTREEFQLLRTHKADMRKLPLFLSILLILEEALPLVVIWAPSLLPSTCVLPSQLIKIRMGAEVKRAEAYQKLRESDTIRPLLPVVDTSAAKVKLSSAHQDEKPAELLSTLSREEMALLAKMFSLATWGGASMVRRRVETHLAYLREDDNMMSKDGHFHALPTGVDALAKACGERGLRCTDVELKEMTETLQHWIQYTTLNGRTRSMSNSSAALLAVQMYRATSLDNVKSSLEAENQRGLIAKTKDVLREVVEEEKKVLSRQEAAKRPSSSH